MACKDFLCILTIQQNCVSVNSVVVTSNQTFINSWFKFNYLNLDLKIIATDLVINERLEQKESKKKLRKSACDRFSEFVFAPPQGWLGRSNADLSTFELPAGYCAEALLSIK